jgi:HSP20 family protein
MPEDKKIQRLTFVSEQWVSLRMPSCQQEIETAFEEIIHKVWGRAAWRPMVDIFETAESFIVIADLAGVGPGELKVTAVNDFCISIDGERTELKEREIERVLVRERPAGRFSRILRFHHPLDLTGIRQEFDAGVLILTIPKSKRGAIR